MKIKRLTYKKLLSFFICIYTLFSVNISFLCFYVNAEENSDPVYTESYLYDIIRDRMIPGVGDPDKVQFDRLIGQAIRNPVVTDPSFASGAIGIGIGSVIDAEEIGRKVSSFIPTDNTNSPVIKWCDGVPYAYDGANGTYYCIPPELYPQINDPNFWGGRPPWGDPNQRGEIDVNAITNFPWIYLEDPKNNGVDDEFVDKVRGALGLPTGSDGVGDGTDWASGQWCSYTSLDNNQKVWQYGYFSDFQYTDCYIVTNWVETNADGYTARLRPCLYKAIYKSGSNDYWWKLVSYFDRTSGSWRGEGNDLTFKWSFNSRFRVLYEYDDFPIYYNGNGYGYSSSEIPFGGFQNDSDFPLLYQKGTPYQPQKFYDGDDVDTYNDEVGQVLDGLSDDPAGYLGLPSNEQGQKQVPIDNPDDYPGTYVPKKQPIEIPTDPGGGGDDPGGGGDDSGGGGDSGDTPTPDGSNNNPIYVYPKVDPDIEFPPVVNTPDEPLFKVPDLTTFFPFCLVFDVGRALSLMLDGDQEPVFDVPMHITYNNQVIVDYNFHLDLRDYGIETVVGYIKVIELIAYIIILCIATFRVLGGE